jgi:pimeloyl-ACP methyl ester carboxylesterase
MKLHHATIHGHDIAFRQEGRGPLLMLIHGMAATSATWRHVIPALAQQFTVVAPDLMGHGASAKPRTDYSLGAYASGIRDLMAALGHDRGTLVGHSFGGGVAMQTAYQFPELCERLVLVDSGGLGIEVNALLRALSLPGAALALAIGCRPLFGDLAWAALRLLKRRGWRPSPGLVEVVGSYASLADADARRALVQTLRSVIDRHGQRVSGRDRLYLMADVPTLITWGTHDPVIPVTHARDTHASIPGSLLELFDPAGHYPHCDDPEKFVRVLEAFVNATEPARVSAQRWRELLTTGGGPAARWRGEGHVPWAGVTPGSSEAKVAREPHDHEHEQDDPRRRPADVSVPGITPASARERQRQEHDENHEQHRSSTNEPPQQLGVRSAVGVPPSPWQLARRSAGRRDPRR